jgi:hypothetical protein
VHFAKQPYGFILLVIVPATIVIYEELKLVGGEFGKTILKLKKKVKQRREAKDQLALRILSINLLPAKERAFPKVGAFVPIAGTILVLAAMTGSFFSDIEESLGNILGAAESFEEMTEPTPAPTPTPIPQSVVINEVYYRIAQEHRLDSEAASEWAELYNPTGDAVSLNGWSIEDNTSCDNIPGPQSIPAGGYAIISTVSEAEFRAVWTSVPSGVIFIQSPTAIGNGLANNDELILRSGPCPDGPIVDHISWGSNTDGLNPSIPMVPSAGISVERNPDGIDTDTNSDFVEREPPTPGS